MKLWSNILYDFLKYFQMLEASYTYSIVYRHSSAVLTMSTGPPAQDQQNFVWASKFFSFYVDLYIQKNVYIK
jgi:hypothetical protein